MSKLGCNVVRDLLPLYADDVVCEESRELVEAHLQDCESCRRELAVMRSTVILPVNERLQREEAETFGSLKKRLNRKTVLVALLAAFVMTGTFMALFTWNAGSRVCIPAEEAGITVKNIEGILLAEVNHHTNGQVATREFSYTTGGDRKTIVVFYVYETPWDRMLSLFRADRNGQTDSTKIYLGRADYLKAVYYGAFDEQILLLNTEEYLDGLTQVWEKKGI